LIGRNQRDLEERLERLRACVPPLGGLESARDMGWLVGTPDEVQTSVMALERAGVERVVLGHYDLEDAETLEILAEVFNQL
jgi:hypothetical protein